VKQRLPASAGPGFDVFGAIIDVEEIGTDMSRAFFYDFVDSAVGFHGFLFVGEDEPVEILEEWEVGADLDNGEFVSVGKDEGWDTGEAQVLVEGDHAGDFGEDIAEQASEGGEVLRVASRGADLLEESLAIDEAGFVAVEQRGLVDEGLDLCGGGGGFGGDGADDDPVVEVEEDFTEIKDDGFGAMRCG